MDERNIIDSIISTCNYASYTISSGLVIGNIMDYLNNNAGAFGVILGFMTFLGQLYFNWIKHRAYVKSLNADKKED